MGVDREIEESFDFNQGITGITKGASRKQMQLPQTSSFDPSDSKVEEKLKKVLRIGTVDSLVMQLLRPEVQDRSLLSPMHFRTKIREIRELLQKEHNDAKLPDKLYQEADAILQDEENKSELLDQYRHMLLLG